MTYSSASASASGGEGEGTSHHHHNAQAQRVVKHKRRYCKTPGCTKIVKSQGLCQRHGAVAKKCKVEGCPKQAQGNFNRMCSTFITIASLGSWLVADLSLRLKFHGALLYYLYYLNLFCILLSDLFFNSIQ